jgi:hypothetical protein
LTGARRAYPHRRQMYRYLHHRRPEVLAQQAQGNHRKSNQRSRRAGGRETLPSQGAW